MPWVEVKSNAQLEEERKQAVGAEQPKTEVLIGLAGDIRKKWEQAKRAKITIEQEFLKAKRQRDGQYEPAKLTAIKATFGASYTPVYMMVTENKCNAAEAWIRSTILQPGEDPWDLEPTPLPDIPEQLDVQIMTKVMNDLYQSAIAFSQQSGIPFDPQDFAAHAQDMMPEVKNFIKKQVRKKAKEAAKRMKEKIEDQFKEGGWETAIKDCIYDLVTYGVCFLKGPQMNKTLLRKGKMDELTGQWTYDIESQITPKWQRRSPFNIYPAPDAIGTDDTYIIDLINLTPKNLTDLLGVPGYSVTAIKAVLEDYRTGGLREWINIATEKARLEQRETMSIWESEKIDCIHYMGSAQGKYLIEWGLGEDEIPDPLLEYSIEAWMIGRHIIKAMVNPDPLQKKPICKACFNEDPDSFWGRGGIPKMIEDIQNVCNAIARSIVNNVGMAAGPQVEFDKDRLYGNSPVLVPWKVWISTGNQMMRNPAVKFYDPPLIADRLQLLYEFFLKLADEDSGIPRYAHGEGQASIRTASALSMIMTGSNRRMQMIIKNFDEIIQASVEKQFYHNLDFEEMESDLIGDVKVVARGSSSLMAKEQQAVRRNEFMVTTNNPLDAQIIGSKGRKYLLEEAVKALDMDPDDLFQEYEFEQEAFQNLGVNNVTGRPQLEGQQGEVPPEKAPATDVAGRVRSGAETALFQQP